MNAGDRFGVILFPSVSHALTAEKILKKEGLSFKLIPLPKHISSDCGICIRCPASSMEKIVQVLAGRVETTGTCLLE
ncbi:MAG: hypothetical protein A4E73_00979 [Syntrophaceae bacterium PtaU1.Bin231]|nr:MAG: hypothetical protein A4E73_00979 [Syntrophaceae bacterium PtaU1.Bin231]HOG16245.1 DUF3343 domain-containing protein [Syntrophales bacterium]